jgi:hypothetical protein
MAGGEPSTNPPRAIGRVAAWVSCVAGVAVFTLLAGSGMAVVLSGQGSSEQWSRLSDVGQTFGVLSAMISGLALGAVVVTARIQFREMQRNRSEMQRQLEFLAQNRSELHRAAELSHLDLLLKILKMSIDDPMLAAVWPEYEPGLSEERNRQYLYANIIYQFNWASAQMNEYSEEQVLEHMRYLFTSPLMRAYWCAAARARKTLQPGGGEYEFSQKVDELCREYEYVAANAKRIEQQPAAMESHPTAPRWPDGPDDRNLAA